MVPALHPIYPGRPVRKPYARVDFIPPVRDYAFGYRRHIIRSIMVISFSNEISPDGGRSPSPTPLYSRLLDRYLKTTCTVFLPPRIFASYGDNFRPIALYLYVIHFTVSVYLYVSIPILFIIASYLPNP